jgi:hypothetical protein
LAYPRFMRFMGVGFAPAREGGRQAGLLPILAGMRCIYCHERAGLWRRVCSLCSKVIAIIERAGGDVGLAGLVDVFIAEGLTRERVDCVLDAQISGAPTIRDRLTSQMANVLMRNLGMPGRQAPEDVMRIREAMRSGAGAGTWSAGEKPPGEA